MLTIIFSSTVMFCPGSVWYIDCGVHLLQIQRALSLPHRTNASILILFRLWPLPIDQYIVSLSQRCLYRPWEGH